ncbi:hypothetical protein OF83DRAFT_760877 [Amylostereum chailletii]|nr:hypothetical protein OF83DRAFT_760877 [Amylostereum chailletii]
MELKTEDLNTRSCPPSSSATTSGLCMCMWKPSGTWKIFAANKSQFREQGAEQYPSVTRPQGLVRNLILAQRLTGRFPASFCLSTRALLFVVRHQALNPRPQPKVLQDWRHTTALSTLVSDQVALTGGSLHALKRRPFDTESTPFISRPLHGWYPYRGSHSLSHYSLSAVFEAQAQYNAYHGLRVSRSCTMTRLEPPPQTSRPSPAQRSG